MEVFNEKNLLSAWKEVIQHKTHAGADRIGIPEFDKNLQENIKRILFEIDYGIYYVKPAEMLHRKKEIGLVAVEDKIVANCLKVYLNQLSRNYSISNSYAYQEGKSIYGAIDFLQEQKKENPYFYQCDIEEFFSSISREHLAEKLKSYVSDKKLYGLILQFIYMSCYKDGEIINGTGLLLGNPLSPVLSNLYLYELDCQFAQAFPVYVRYSDDMIFAKKQEFTKEELEWIEQRLEEEQLKLNQQKSKVIALGERFTFLGNEFGEEEQQKSKIYIGLETEESKPVLKEIKQNDIVEGEEEKQEEKEKTWKNSLEEIIDKVTDEKIKEEFRQILYKCDKKEQAEDKLMERMLHYRLYLQLKYLLEQKEIKQEKMEWKKVYQELFLRDHYKIFQGSLDRNRIQEYSEKKEADRTEIFTLIEHGSTIAIAPAKDGKSDVFILDLDIDKRLLLEYGEDYEAVQKLKDRIRTIAFTIQKRIQDKGGYAYVEESGYKGYHIWLFFYEMVEITEFWEKMNGILTQVYMPYGCHMEYIPNFGEELIKIPFCRHLLTGRRTRFLALQEEIADQNDWILQIVRNSWSEFLQDQEEEEKEVTDSFRVLEKGEKEIEKWEKAAEIVEKKCSLIGEIVQKAREIHYLTHFERNALLYVYGHIGEIGAWYLHQIMEKTINYNQEITQSFLDKKKEFPVSCDKLKRRFPQFSCRNCKFEEYPLFYPSPVIHAYREDKEHKMHITKPDYINSKERVAKIQEYAKPNRIEELKQLLLELTEKRRGIERDLEICRKEIEGYMQETEGEEKGLLEKSGLVVEDGGIYLRIL